MIKEDAGLNEFMNIKELCEEFKYSRQTIYNKIYRGEFLKNYHYLKPSSKKILFIRSAFIRYLKGEDMKKSSDLKPSGKSFDNSKCYTSKPKFSSAINI